MRTWKWGSGQLFLLKRKCPLEHHLVKTRKRISPFHTVDPTYLLIAQCIDRSVLVIFLHWEIKPQPVWGLNEARDVGTQRPTEVRLCPVHLIFSKRLPQPIQGGTIGFIIPPTFGSILWHFSCCLWFYKATTFHKWKLILSKQMLVSIFCILEKKIWIWFGWGGG